MKRFLLERLQVWKHDTERKPLLLRGARQVGKSYLVNEFSRGFANCVELNFEMEPYLAEIFSDSLEPSRLVERISIAKNADLKSGETLLFLDEIQAAPQALTALRYFHEKMPGLHVIAAGSLIEFALEKTGLPVGRVSSLYLYPLSFREFLEAAGKEKLGACLDEHDLNKPLAEVLYRQLLDCFAQYMAVGGMPEAVNTWLINRDMKKVRRVHNDIIETYRQDFLKYAKKQQIHHVDKVFAAVPRLLGKKFVYAQVDQGLKSREIKPALDLLEMAQVAHRVRHSAGNGVPLEGQCNDSLFKVIFLDIGLSQALLGVNDGDWMLNMQRAVSNRGAVVEAFVGQEILAMSDPGVRRRLFYWVREKAHAKSEVDYLVEKNDRVIPVEVKSGSTGSLKSLKQFLLEKPEVQYGVHLSPANFGSYRNIRQIPLVAVWRLSD